MPATSSKVTVCVSPSTRRARERPNWPSTPPPEPAEAARRNSQMKSATSRIVGPKLNRIVSSSERLPGGFALTTTSCSSSRFASCSSSAKVGTSVSKRLADSSSYFTSFLNSPWSVSPVDEISLTLSPRSWFRKVGV